MHFGSNQYALLCILATLNLRVKQENKVLIKFVTPVLEFLETRTIISHSGGKYIVNQSFIFIHKDSPLFSHQQNFWRQKAIESVYENKPEHLHFASIFTVSEKDLKKIKDVLLKSIEDTTEIIKPSKEEKLYSICMDLFEVK